MTQGKISQAIEALAEAQVVMSRGGEHRMKPELYRLRAAISLAQGSLDRAEAAFGETIRQAQDDEAKSLDPVKGADQVKC
jgi:hypothetical protein